MLLKAAVKYMELGFSVIPTKSDKKPFIKWTDYQSKRADREQLEEWWKKWPKANPAVVTGAISGITVVDCDSLAGKDALSEFLPELFETPIAKTPKGWHFYFQYQEGISNGVRVLTDCDVRNDAGYIILPPIQNGTGKKYAWGPGLKITDVPPAKMPDMLADVLRNGGADQASSRPREHIEKVKTYKKEKIPSRTQGETIAKHFSEKTKQNETKRNNRNISFKKGFRDDSLFHVATCLHRGGMALYNIRKTLHLLGDSCSPAFPHKEIEAKLDSVLKRSATSELGLTDQIRAFISETWGAFSATEAKQNVTSETSKNLQPKIRSILSRIARNEGTIEPVPDRSGRYRKVESDCDAEDWQNACTETVDLWLPFGLDDMALIAPGSVIVVAGAPNAGKTAILMNIAKENRHNWDIHYFSSELGKGAFKRRMENFPDVTVDQLNINFYQRGDNFQDVIKPGQGNLNIIDYLEIYENFYLVSKHLAEIYRKLDGAIAIVAVQKDEYRDDGRGGGFTREKPVLSLSVDPGKVKITKLKEWREGLENPNRKEYHFKLISGCRFKMVSDWHKPMKD
jgi:hypothetical protein